MDLKTLAKNQNKKKPIKLKTVNAPRTLEVQYIKAIKELSNQLKEFVRLEILPNLESATKQVQATTDSVSDILRALNRMNARFGNIQAFSESVASKLIEGLNIANRTRFVSSVKSQFGIDPELMINQNNVRDIVELQKNKNVALIKSIPQEFIKDIEVIVQNGISEGLRHEEIARQIKGIKNISSVFGKLDNRVKLIARNEVGTINSNLRKARFESAGVDLYEWSTSNDERVRGNPNGKYPNARPRHDVMDGKICTFKDLTVYADNLEDAKNGKWKKRSSIGGVEKHPGQDISCRCNAIAIIDID